MLLKQGFAATTIYVIPAGTITSPAGIFLSKNGSAFGALIAGVAVSLGVSAGYDHFVVSLAAGDTDIVGPLAVIIYDGAGAFIVQQPEQVVSYLPGEVEPAHRLLIAGDTWGLVDGIELGLTPQNALRVAFAVLAGKDSSAFDVVRFRNFGDTKDRVTATVDPTTKTRLAVTYDFS